MSQYYFDDHIIQGGTIDGTPIGQTTPAAGSFTTLTATTSMTVPTILDGYSTTATAAGTTTLTASSNYHQFFTGTTTQTVKMPVTSTLTLGQDYRIVNNSTGVVTVTSSGDNSIVAMVPGSECILTCILLTGTTAASWDIKYGGIGSVTGTGGMVLATSPTLVTPALGTPSGGTLTSCTGLPTGGVTMAATAKILGRATAGAGVAEEIAVTGSGNVVLATSPTLVTPVLGAATGTSLATTGSISGTMDEIIQAASDTLTAAEVKGTIISNYGQGAGDNLQTLPTAAEGMNFIGVCGTAQAAHYFRFQADTNDKVYLNGVAGADNGSVSIAVPVVGSSIVFYTFQTGAGVYDWGAITVSGLWTAV